MFGIGVVELMIIAVVALVFCVLPIVAICWLVVALVRRSEERRPPHLGGRDGGDRPGG